MAKKEDPNEIDMSGDSSWGDLGVESDLSWKDVDPAIIGRFITCLTDRGARVTFSFSKTSGSLGVNVFYNQEPKTWYPASVEATELLLQTLITRFSGMRA
jgi:hypothetical protein